LNSIFSSSVQSFQKSLNSSMDTGRVAVPRYFLRVTMEFSCSGTMAPFGWVYYWLVSSASRCVIAPLHTQTQFFFTMPPSLFECLVHRKIREIRVSHTTSVDMVQRAIKFVKLYPIHHELSNYPPLVIANGFWTWHHYTTRTFLHITAGHLLRAVLGP
jgi:hypothetical protein